MRLYHDIDLSSRNIQTRELHGEDIVRCGRYLIADTLLKAGAATVDPLSPANPLIFSAGPFAGTNFSNANRISVGCKSPLTGGVKEANGGGTFAFALGQLEIAGLTLTEACDDWTIIRITKDGEINFVDASPYMGMGNFETAAKLHAEYGKKVSLALCGPVGEYLGLMAGISFSDVDLRPSRLAARGGVGAVMGSKKVKAIVVDLHKMPPLHDRKKVMGSVKEYRRMLEAEPAIEVFKTTGTAMMADIQNHLGGIPVRNFSAGRAVDTEQETFKLGGDFLREQNIERGGEQSHACMPGCIIQCSNVYVDKDGEEIVSPVEYETIGLLGTNCGLSDPDELARLNFAANNIGVDTIELGGMIGVLMDAGEGKFGDAAYMQRVMDDMKNGTEAGKIYAQGTKRVGDHFKVERVPVIKGQAISAYDPRVVEVTGITMMLTAQGADHTAGNMPTYESQGKSADELVEVSLDAQVVCAANDSLGLCIFGRSVTNTNEPFLLNAMKDAHDIELTPGFFEQLGKDALKLEADFNRAAGFTTVDDELPSFFYDEVLPPSDKAARFHHAEVNASAENWWN